MDIVTNDRIGVCNCGSFLIYNFFFKGRRFLCLSCGSMYVNAPRYERSTIGGEARLAAIESEFLVNCGSKLFCTGMQKLDCLTCNQSNQEHIQHVAKRDWVLVNDALKWLSDRTGREFGMVNGDLGHYHELMREVQAVSL